MRKVVTIMLSMAWLVFAGETHQVDTAKSKVDWEASKVTGSHDGGIEIASGELVFEDGKLSGGEFTMNMRTISNRDIEDADTRQKLIDHLNSDDFFSTEKFPEAKFVISEVMAGENENEYVLNGNMTIKGITKPVSFTATIDTDKGMANAVITLDRTEWNVRYGSGKFFENLGDRMIYDEFTLTVELALASAE
jgi:polyisoprenoid-binding protein YceI